MATTREEDVKYLRSSPTLVVLGPTVPRVFPVFQEPAKENFGFPRQHLREATPCARNATVS